MAPSVAPRLRPLAIGLIALLVASCGSSIDSVSAEGVAKCKEEIAVKASSLYSTKERQALFRQCLRSIDNRIELQSRSAQEQLRITIKNQKASSGTPQNASATEIFKFCSSRKEQIQSLVQRYNEITGEISRQGYLSAQPGEDLASLEDQQRRVMGDIEALIAPDYRLGKPLIPDAAALLIRCNQQEIISSQRI